MKKGDMLQGIVERVDFPTKGILHAEDRRVEVKGVIEGQEIEYRVTKKRRDRVQGMLKAVITPSPLENKEPSCPHFPACGGCTYQTVSYENQLKIKEKQVKSLLDPVCDDYVWEGIKGSPIHEAYRNKMEFSFGDEVKDGPLALGLHKKNSTYDIVNIEKCNIVDEDYNKIVTCVKNYFLEKQLPFYKKMQHVGYLRHLVIRSSIKTGDLLVNLVTTTQMDEDMTPLVELLTQLKLNGKITGILHTLNDSLSDVVQSDETRILYGQDYLYEYLFNLKFKISPYSFFQTNTLGAEVLYDTARSYVGDTKDKVIFDLYSGTGTISQMLAPVAKKVIGIEIVEEAVEAAKINAALNHIDNCEFIAGDVLKAIDDVKITPDIIVLDPPRDGIHPKALQKIIQFGVDEMIYISCKPTSLVRDLAILKENGYVVKKAVAIDQFCNTPHVETVCLLSKKCPV